MSDRSTCHEMHIVFFSHYEQIPDVAYLASILCHEYGHKCSLWTLGSREAERGQQIGVFDEVFNLLPDSEKLEPGVGEIDRHLTWIRELEVRIGAPFWRRDIAQDRYFQGLPTIEVAQREIPIEWTEGKVAALIRYVGEFIKGRFVAGNVDGVYVELNSACYRLCRRLASIHDVPTAFFKGTRQWKDRGYFETELGYEWKECRKRYRRLRSGLSNEVRKRAEDRLHRIRENNEQPRGHLNNSWGPPSISDRLELSRITRSLRDWWEHSSEDRTTHPRRMPSHVISPWGKLKRYIRTLRSQRYYRRVVNRDVSLDRSFAIFFLQVQPEATVEAMGFEYQDQVATIRNLASGLPADISMYVKEHKPHVGRRPIEFYSELTHIPGVRLIDERLHSHRLIRKADVVLTLTGTAGLESIVYGTPALVLGNVFFNDFEGVYHPGSIQKACRLLQDVSELEGATEKEAVRTLAAMYEASVQGVYPPEPDSKPELSKRTAHALHDFLQEK